MTSSSTQRADRAAAFEIFTRENAPEASRSALKQLEQSVGVIPNLAGTMAGSPALIQAFVTLREVNAKASSLTAQEMELFYLTSAVTNACAYCQAVHSIFAAKAGLPPATIEAVRRAEPLPDSRQNALVTFGRVVVENRGRLKPADVRAFLSAGFEKTHILDVVACLAQSILANYTNHIADVEFDEFLKPKDPAIGA